jgi:hypothetical protein
MKLNGDTKREGGGHEGEGDQQDGGGSGGSNDDQFRPVGGTERESEELFRSDDHGWRYLGRSGRASEGFELTHRHLHRHSGYAFQCSDPN